jgi:CPA1 family monovalent cation:H+ antiporter
MRGVLALAAALSLPDHLANGQPFPHRSLIIFLTFAVICATLICQGLSMPALIRALRLGRSSASQEEEAFARKQMIRAALGALAELRHKDQYTPQTLDAVEHFYSRQAAMLQVPDGSAKVSKEDAEAVYRLAHDLRNIERDVALRLRDEDRIHDEVLRTLERELDLLEARFSEIESY